MIELSKPKGGTIVSGASQNIANSLVTAGSHPESKLAASIRKPPLSRNNTLHPKSLEIAAQVSTSKEKALRPYWNDVCRENSSQLLSPTGIDSLASASILLSGSLSEAAGISWSSIKSAPVRWRNLPETLPLLSPCSLPDSTVCEVTRTRKLLLKPSTTQKALLRRWKGTYRFVYNWVVSAKAQAYEESGASTSYMKNRKQWTRLLREQYPWVEEAPAHTVYGAMMDADRDYVQTIKKRSRGLKAELPRCRKRTQRSFFVLGNAVTEKGIYPRKLGLMRSAEKLPNKPKDCRIIHDADGRWYLSVPYVVKCGHTENQSVIALDPGVRTFLTGLASDKAIKIGEQAFNRVVRLTCRLDELLSRASKAPAKTRRSMKKAAGRLRVRIRNLVDDLHYQTIGWLCRNYRTIIIPESDFSSACRKAKRKIGRKSVRSLLTWAFARFRDRLRHKAEVLGCTVLTVNEAYTSKTANWTGEIIQKLGGRKTITSGGVTLDRDLNGALGILLKSLLDQPRTDVRASVSKG